MHSFPVPFTTEGRYCPAYPASGAVNGTLPAAGTIPYAVNIARYVINSNPVSSQPKAICRKHNSVCDEPNAICREPAPVCGTPIWV
ncbi:hypothetical protein [Sinomicrobium weinanense]|uniref:Uncharacterized protein n=1 Tax=Sinomicrobium weinanense TaxID=2842200 RepID=A0A926Q0Q7_9FLAO|nr:hypothetical protein [Sinomicrobium weinanense]MBC9795142.1 hypothetical protein [Sinomicrobium weinanense]